MISPRCVDGAEVSACSDDNAAANDHCDRAGELATASLHAILNGESQVHKAHDQKDSAEELHTR